MGGAFKSLKASVEELDSAGPLAWATDLASAVFPSSDQTEVAQTDKTNVMESSNLIRTSLSDHMASPAA